MQFTSTLILEWNFTQKCVVLCFTPFTPFSTLSTRFTFREYKIQSIAKQEHGAHKERVYHGQFLNLFLNYLSLIICVDIKSFFRWITRNIFFHLLQRIFSCMFHQKFIQASWIFNVNLAKLVINYLAMHHTFISLTIGHHTFISYNDKLNPLIIVLWIMFHFIFLS